MSNYLEQIRNLYEEFLDFCLEWHDHETEAEIIDCFLDGIREKLPPLTNVDGGWELKEEKK